MQYLNDDMDELFRKAAEEYSLNTGAADWEKVNVKLAEETVATPPANNSRFLWLLLLPFTIICNRLTDSNYFSTPPVTIAAAPPVGMNSQQAKQPTVRPTKQILSTPSTASGLGAAQGRFETGRKDVLPKATTIHPKKNRLHEKAVAGENINPFIENETGSSAVLNTTPLQDVQTITAAADSAIWAAEDHPKIEKQGVDSLVASTTLTDSVLVKQKTQFSSLRKKGFYAGIVAGPDLSTIKFEKFSQVGFQAGLLVGYAFHQRWAVEAGVLTGKKYYYSEGEYVKTSGSYTPPYAKLLSVDGNCRMIELPVSLRYNILQNKRHSLFGTAGVSSYLMQSEDYTYDYLYLASGNIVSYQRNYTDKPKNWLSVLQLSVGYTLAPNALGELRIEPYYAIPLKGVGHGKLPISSVGVRFGITSKHF